MSRVTHHREPVLEYLAGALWRRDVRAVLDAEGVRWTEHKAWLVSHFVIRGTPAQLASVELRLEALR